MDGWNENNAMSFVLSGSGNRTAEAYETSPSVAPRLYVTFIKDPSQIKLAVPIKVASDDMEEETNGDLDDGSSDLEIVDESTNQIIGLRFQDIIVPRGAKITEAYVQFTVDEIKDSKNRDPFNVDIHAEDTVNSTTFNPAVKYDVSSRTKTQTKVVWKDIPKWEAEGLAGEEQRTADISTLIQEIIDKEGWLSGNAISLILSGTGTRTAESYEGADNIEQRPTLNIVYSLGDEAEPEDPKDTPTIKVYAKDNSIVREKLDTPVQVEYYLAIKDADELNAFDIIFEFADNKLKFNNVELLSDGDKAFETSVAGNKLRIVGGFTSTVNTTEYVDIAKLTFDVISVGEIVKLSNLVLGDALFASSEENVEAPLNKDIVESDIIVAVANLDINGDGKVNIADLSYALDFYRAEPTDSNWADAQKSDVNKDGIVDLTDFTLIIKVIIKQI